MGWFFEIWFEIWGEVVYCVVLGNVMLVLELEVEYEYECFCQYILWVIILLFGRYFQYGDYEQLKCNMEVFMNCLVCLIMFGLFYLLLNGSGVGRVYDEDMILIDWWCGFCVYIVISVMYVDYDLVYYIMLEELWEEIGIDVYDKVYYWKVGDSWEGWVWVIEYWEGFVYWGIGCDKNLILNFLDVCFKGFLIMGMQGCLLFGLVFLMEVFMKVVVVVLL